MVRKAESGKDGVHGVRRIAADAGSPIKQPLVRAVVGGYVSDMDWRSRITIHPDIRGGKPCLRGMRLAVADVLEYLASGMSESDIVRDFPELERDDIRACLLYAAERERTFTIVPPAA